MSQTWVLDASALLAAIQNEPGSDFVKQHIKQSVISSVNWSEVLQNLAVNQLNVEHIEAMLMGLGLTIVDFTCKEAHLAAALWPQGKTLGLSLADRACLATGLHLQQAVVTADQVWKQLDCGITVHLIR